jgi:hypothetical protein
MVSLRNFPTSKEISHGNGPPQGASGSDRRRAGEAAILGQPADLGATLGPAGPHHTGLRRRRYVVHFTPTSASWLNQVERFFAEITQKRIRRGAFRSVLALEAAIKDYLEKHNQDSKPFVWTATADLIFRKLQATCETVF